MTVFTDVGESKFIQANLETKQSTSKFFHKIDRIKTILVHPSFRSRTEDSASLLDAVENEPQRWKPITDALLATKCKIADASQKIYHRCTQLKGSILDIFEINVLLDKFKNTSMDSMVKIMSPYLIAGLSEYMLHASKNEKETVLFDQLDMAKLAACCIILGYSMKQRITQPSKSNVVKRVMQQSASIFALVNLHVMSYQAGDAASDWLISPLHSKQLITDETQQSLNLLTGIIATGVVLPKLLLIMANTINASILKKERLAGKGTQSSRNAVIPNGLTPELNFALQVNDHLLKQLSDPARLFQFFIVTLNVLKDTDIPDPSAPTPAKTEGNVLRKTRNIWLLATESFLKAKHDLKNRLADIATDTEINHQKYSIIRNGTQINQICRYQLQVGDLVSLDQAVKNFQDPLTGTIRTKAALSGYLIDCGKSPISKKVVINLAELNGESKPIILDPSRQPKSKGACLPIDLHTVASTGAIFFGTEFLSFDNDNPSATSENLYLQIADSQEQAQHRAQKVPYSAQQIADLKEQLIKGVFVISCVAALALIAMETPSRLPYSPSPSLAGCFQLYCTQFIDKFTQVFVEAQTLIPLTADVVLEATNSELLRNLNSQLEDKITLNNALLISDLFQAIHEKRMRIYSDKTGTVTETFMQMKGIVCEDSAQDRVLTAFATTYSDQKTEAEENEINRFYAVEKGINITSKPVPGHLNHLEKVITKDGRELVRFISKRIGLFTDFGGQFTIREEHGKKPVLTFCGVPRAGDKEEMKFRSTPLLHAHEEYERSVDQTTRQDSLTRDWSIAEVELSPETYLAFLQAMEMKNSEQSKKTINDILQSLTKEFGYLGTFPLDNPIKAGAREAIQEWNKAGMVFRLITGDTKSAGRLITTKLYADKSERILDMEELLALTNWRTQDLSRTTVILTDTKPATMTLLDELEALGNKQPNVIFCQMKDIDKKNLVVRAKKRGEFIIAMGDGCNDLMMLNAADMSIGASARDGSFARGVQEASTITDIQVRQLMKQPNCTLHQLFDVHKGKKSKVLKPFAFFANTQPKVITSLLGKVLKSVAIPRALGWQTNEIPGQFGILLGYDAAFLAATYQANIATANVPLVDRPINQSKLPLVTLLSATAFAAAQSLYAYANDNHQVTTEFMLICNLALSVGCLSIFLSPPGYALKVQEEQSHLHID